MDVGLIEQPEHDIPFIRTLSDLVETGEQSPSPRVLLRIVPLGRSIRASSGHCVRQAVPVARIERFECSSRTACGLAVSLDREVSFELRGEASCGYGEYDRDWQPLYLCAHAWKVRRCPQRRDYFFGWATGKRRKSGPSTAR